MASNRLEVKCAASIWGARFDAKSDPQDTDTCEDKSVGQKVLA